MAILAGFIGLTGINWITGTKGTTKVMGMVEARVLVKGTCAVEGALEGGLLDVDDEPRVSRVDRNRTLIGVVMKFGLVVSGVRSVRVPCPYYFLMILGIVLGLSKTVGGLGSGFDLVNLVSLLGASF